MDGQVIFQENTSLRSWLDIELKPNFFANLAAALIRALPGWLCRTAPEIFCTIASFGFGSSEDCHISSHCLKLLIVCAGMFIYSTLLNIVFSS